MKRLISLFLIVLMFCAVISVGCGGGGSDDPEQFTYDIGEDTGDYDPNEEGRGNSGRTVNLSTITTDYTAQNGEVLTGNLAARAKISIADGAAVTIRDVVINGENSSSYKFAGLTCAGDATRILEGTNDIKGFYSEYPGIYVPEGKTLTIDGDGSLNASSNGYAPGIAEAIRFRAELS